MIIGKTRITFLLNCIGCPMHCNPLKPSLPCHKWAYLAILVLLLVFTIHMVKTIVFGIIIIILLRKFVRRIIKKISYIAPGNLTTMTQLWWPWPIFQGHRSIQSQNFKIFKLQYLKNYQRYSIMISQHKSCMFLHVMDQKLLRSVMRNILN